METKPTLDLAIATATEDQMMFFMTLPANSRYSH
jgi:hypothetical protein